MAQASDLLVLLEDVAGELIADARYDAHLCVEGAVEVRELVLLGVALTELYSLDLVVEEVELCRGAGQLPACH